MSDQKKPQKIGAGHLSAMARLGLAELRSAMYTQSNVVQQHSPYGVWGTKTPGEVMQDREGETRDPDERPSILNERLKQVEQTIAEQDVQFDRQTPEPEHEPER